MTPDTVTSEVKLNSLLTEILPFGKYITFLIKKVEKDTGDGTPRQSIFQRMMEQRTKVQLPPRKVERTGIDKMYNAFLKVLEEKTLGWCGIGDIGARFITAVTDLLWKVRTIISSRCRRELSVIIMHSPWCRSSFKITLNIIIFLRFWEIYCRFLKCIV